MGQNTLNILFRIQDKVAEFWNDHNHEQVLKWERINVHVQYVSKYMENYPNNYLKIIKRVFKFRHATRRFL